MAITEQVEKEQSNMLLNNGRDSAGNIKTVKVGIGTLNPNAWDAQKISNITATLSYCLSKSLYAVNHVRTSLLIDE